MCSIGLAVGIASFAGSAMSAVGEHQAQAAAVARSNAIAQQQYQQELQIAATRDQEQLRTYEAELKADTAAKNAYYAQISANQVEANRALASVNQKEKEKRTTQAFGAQNTLKTAIEKQGAVLATGKAGQSFLLQAMDAERTMGFELAQVEQSLYDASLASDIERTGILLDQKAANTAAWNGLPAAPLSPQASFLPAKPIMAEGPSSLSLLGGIVGAGASGASVGISTHATLNPPD